MNRIVIPHIDDVACSHSANQALVELARAGTVTCGSVMVPPAWFAEVSGLADLSELDLGIHLTLTSESVAFRWRPISTLSRASGLVDDDGFMWPTVPLLRAQAHPEAVEAELRAQIERALAVGIDVTHLDHHMGAALSPEFVASTVQLAHDYRLPVLCPSDLRGYVGVLNMGPFELEALARARADLGDWAFADTFCMGLTYQSEPDAAATFRRVLADLPAGVSYLSLHCSSPGDIEHIHPKDADWRIAEYRLFSDPGLITWMLGIGLEIGGMREVRDRMRNDDGR